MELGNLIEQVIALIVQIIETIAAAITSTLAVWGL